MNDVAKRLDQLIQERGEEYSALSRLIGRNAAYIHQFITRGTPRKLAEDDRRILAAYFGVDEALLGGPALPPPPAVIMVPRLAVGASAGPGSVGDDEAALGHIGFDRTWLRRHVSQLDAVSIIQVAGDSMMPTLRPGDDILVDRGDGADRLRDGIYVLRRDDMLSVKRIALAPGGANISIRSDNPHYPDWNDVAPASITIIGRVIWAGGAIG
ncbi:MAG: helix-turn-helix transcriptional regulator [Sphingomonadaceae bacterium]